MTALPPAPPIQPQQIDQLIHATRQQTIATMTAAIIGRSERPWSVHDALELMTDVHFTMFPEPASGRYAEWAKTKDARLSKKYGAAA